MIENDRKTVRYTNLKELLGEAEEHKSAKKVCKEGFFLYNKIAKICRLSK